MFEEIGADLGRRIDSYAQTNGGTGVLLVAVSSDGEIAGFLDVGLRRLSSTNRSFIPCSTDDLKATLDVPRGGSAPCISLESIHLTVTSRRYFIRSLTRRLQNR